jgi:hypothetical protein
MTAEKMTIYEITNKKDMFNELNGRNTLERGGETMMNR